jgi:hypothetical protein
MVNMFKKIEMEKLLPLIMNYINWEFFFLFFFLGIMDKFLIMNVYDATPKSPKNNP